MKLVIEYRNHMDWIYFRKLSRNHKLITILVFTSVIFSVAVILLAGTLIAPNQQTSFENPTFSISPTPSLTTSPTLNPTPTPIPTPTIPPVSSKIIFGIGSQAGPAMNFRLVKESPVKMLTSWYNGTSDLEWMRVQKNDLIPRLYKNNYIVHIITWTDLPEHNIDTPHGPACGRPYPVSSQVVEDMKQLAQIYNGPGSMYVTLFTEFPTFTCIDNNWIGNENYWNTLKDNYRKILAAFHQYAPNSKVSLGWGGWIGLYDDKVNQGGRSLVPYFADVIIESDFASFQAMESDTNVPEIKVMTKILGSYGKPVMLAHYKPSNHSIAVYESDLNAIFTDQVMRELTGDGLFAMSFMDSELIDNSESSYQIVKNGIIKYAK